MNLRTVYDTQENKQLGTLKASPKAEPDLDIKYFFVRKEKAGLYNMLFLQI